MSKRNIIILIVLTAILIAVSITTIRNEPDIENIYLSSDKDINTGKLEQNNDHYYFNDSNIDIYLIIKVKYLTTQDEIKVEWEKIEDNSFKIIQENTIHPEQKGSGKIVISLVKRNATHPPGKYTVDVFLNGSKQFSKQFSISDDSHK